MSKRGKIIAGVVTLLVLVAIGVGVALASRNIGITVTTGKVTKGDLAVTVAASGKVEAGVRADIYPPTGGTIHEVLVEDGAPVKAGQTIAVMDTGPLELAVDQARAGYRAADSQLDAVRKQVPTTVDRRAAAANTAVAADAYHSAADAYTALKDVYDALPSSMRSSMEATVTALRQARDRSHAAYLSAKAQEAKLSVAGGVSAQRSAARASRDQASAALRLAELNLDRATLTAPIAGVVIFNAMGVPGADGTTPKAGPGSAVGPQAAPFTVYQLDSLRFDADVDEVDVPSVKIGMKGIVRLDAFSKETFPTTVSHIKPTATQTITGGTVFPVYLDLADTGKGILIGMKGDATIELQSIPDAVQVPIEAVLDEGGVSYVFVVSSGKAKRVDVKVGTMTEIAAQILSGVKPGDEVVLSGGGVLKDGMPVRTK
ncbi:MAG: efflux RND transporter periplasmic adaptor subunit [Coriobacteriia bacterium]